MTQANTAPAGAGASARCDQPGVSTREKTLDVALDLFTDQGFDGTSMREIAERLHISKPAIYYHFASKDEILMALHMRLHEFGKAALARLTGQTVTLQTWGSLLDEVLDQMLAQRKIFLMHERNQAALEKLHRKDHDDEHDDIQQRFRRHSPIRRCHCATGSGWHAHWARCSGGCSWPGTRSTTSPAPNSAPWSGTRSRHRRRPQRLT